MKQILKVLVGSRAHGLNTPDSDYDWRAVVMFAFLIGIGVFLPSWLFMIAWNFVAPVFNGPVLTYW